MPEEHHVNTEFFKLVAALSKDFVTASYDELGVVTKRAMATIGQHFSADRCYLFEFSADDQYADNTYEWCADGITPQLEHLQNLPSAEFGTWLSAWQRGEVVQIARLSDLPLGSPERNLLEPQGIRSVIMLPLLSSDGLLGMFGIDLVHQSHDWSPEETAALELVAGNLCGGLLRQRAEQQAHTLTLYDPVTGLPNRRHLASLLSKFGTESMDPHAHSAILLLDLDHFKTLNDSHGHDYGDLLLVELAHRLTQLLKPEDALARVGGDEFALVVRDLAPDRSVAEKQADAVALQAMRLCSQVFSLEDVQHHISLSVGICMFADSDDSVDSLLRHAEIAMYAAKASGRGAIRFYDAEMQARAHTRAAMERALRTAVDEQQLLLHFQPQVDLHAQLLGFEALVRWQHPERGLVGPLSFIPFAEDSGLILPIGQWVLHAACRQLAAWSTVPALQALSVSVNISLVQFRQADFVDQVLTALESAGAPAGQLQLEITESLFAVDIDDVIQKMTELQAAGVGFSLDDFGTGYSSLSYLKRLPLSEVKIDKSFVQDILADSNDVAIAKMVVALADTMGLRVIAEGVEQAAQRDILARLGCHGFQGFWFSPPLTSTDVMNRFGQAQ